MRPTLQIAYQFPEPIMQTRSRKVFMLNFPGPGVAMLPITCRKFGSTSAKQPSGHGLKYLLGAIFAGYSYYQYDNYARNRELARRLDMPIHRILLYKAVPFGPLSVVAGYCASVPIPSFLRRPLFSAFASAYGCNLNDSKFALHEYPTFGAFFSRPLRTGARTIATVDGLVSPSDGTLLHCGSIGVQEGALIFPEQVKGSLYSLSELIGDTACAEFRQRLSAGSSVYYCTIYLGPGDYHRFHAPARMSVVRTEKMPGEALSVAPWLMRRIPKLLCMNQRVSLQCRWKYGQLCYVPVGAANVGSIVLNDSKPDPSVAVAPGHELGRFELGSTVVLVFEGPEKLCWKKVIGERCRMGDVLIEAPKRPWWNTWQ